MNSPDWDLDSRKGRDAMYRWIEFKLDERMVSDANELNNLRWPEELLVPSLKEKVRAGTATPAEREEFFNALSNSPKPRRGRPVDPIARIRRHPERHMAEILVPRIKKLWQTHYGRTGKGHSRYAVEFAVRWFWGDEDTTRDGVDFQTICGSVEAHLERGNRKMS